MTDVTIPMRKVVSTITLRVTGAKIAGLRLRLGALIIKLGGFIMGTNLVIETDDDQRRRIAIHVQRGIAEARAQERRRCRPTEV